MQESMQDRATRILRPGKARSTPALPVLLLAALLWGLAVGGPPLLFLRWRESRLVALADPAVQAEWDAFRDDMRRQSGRDGPVQRKVPKSPEPPELVWLRDYPHLAITAWTVLVGVLGGFLVLTAVGARAAAVSAAEDRPGRTSHDEKQHERDSEHTEQ
jgi:hypothetical protein